jgi:acyl-CoA thioester hydrolase
MAWVQDELKVKRYKNEVLLISETFVRVRYGETDQMGLLYYGHYALYYEVGRAEAFRSLGYTYRRLEEEGILMVVAEFHARYLRPLEYDELVRIKTSLRQLPQDSRMKFHSELYNEAGLLVNAGVTTLVILDKHTKQKRLLPEPIKELLKGHFGPDSH